jgi:hypothetical protein
MPESTGLEEQIASTREQLGETANDIKSNSDYVGQFSRQQSQSYNNMPPTQALQTEYRNKSTSFALNVVPYKQGINEQLKSEYAKLSAALQPLITQNVLRNIKNEADIKKTFDKAVEKQFDQAWNKQQPVAIKGIADQIYYFLTGATEMPGSDHTQHFNHSQRSYAVDTENSSRQSNRASARNPEQQRQLGREAKRAMSRDLIDFFHNIKNPTFFQKLYLKNTPSAADRKAVSQFIKLVDKLDFNNYRG